MTPNIAQMKTIEPPTLPGEIGVMFFLARVPTMLHDVQVGPGAVIVKVAIGDQIVTPGEGQTWAMALDGKKVEADEMVSVHVENLLAEAKVIEGHILMSLDPGSSEPSSLESGALPPVPPARESRRRDEPVRQMSPGLMTNMPPIRDVRQKPQQATASGGSVRREGNTLMRQLPPIRGKDVASGNPATTATAGGSVNAIRSTLTQMMPARRATRTVERELVRVQRHGSSANPPMAGAASGVSSGAATQASNGENVIDIEGKVIPGTGGEASPDGWGEEPGTLSVLLLKGHAFALLSMLEHRNPINEAFKLTITHAFGSAMTRKAEVEVEGGNTEVLIRLSPRQMQAIVNIMMRGRGTLANAESPALAQPLKRAFAFDAAKQNARSTQRAMARVG